MSNAIKYDPLVISYLARELDARLAGRAAALAPAFGPERTTTLAIEGDVALQLDLHPARGWIRLVPAAAAAELDGRITAVAAPADERWLELRLEATTRFRAIRRRLLVELLANQWNALFVDAADDRILGLAWPRQTGTRTLRPGEVYTPPVPRPRRGPADGSREELFGSWQRSVGRVGPDARRAELLRGFAYSSPLNAAEILGETDRAPYDDAAAFERWWRLASQPAPEPVLLRLDGRLQPYPVPLPGTALQQFPSLLAAIEAAAGETAPGAADPAATELLAAIERHQRRAQRRVERLREQLERTVEIERARRFGDLLLANLPRVPRGASSVRLPDWEGGEVEIPLDPARSAADNADRWYAEARRFARAAARGPRLLAAAQAELDRWTEAAAAAREGRLGSEVLAQLGTGERADGARRGVPAERLPFRRFRTSGGLEVRVGRGAADNDRLTFRHASPNDVWLHARSVSGSHVILRWHSADQAPPATDLAEAAALAAWYSRARSSGLVAVDWTRRKYVRKPRGAAPGTVIPQRVKTVFVEPDAALAQRLASGPGEDAGPRLPTQTK